MDYRQFYSVGLLFLYCEVAIGQLYLCPKIGIDLSKIESAIDAVSPQLAVITDRGFHSKSLSLGLNFQYQLDKRNLLNIGFDYNRKKSNAAIAGIANFDGILFDYTRSTFSYKRVLNYDLSFYLGCSVGSLSNFRYFYQDEYSDVFEESRSNIALFFATSYCLKKCEILPFLNIDIGKNKKIGTNSDLLLKPVNSVGLQLLYKFIFLKKKF